MKIKLFNKVLVINVSLVESDSFFALQIEKKYRETFWKNIPKIGLVKAARELYDISLYDSKNLVERLFVFDGDRYSYKRAN